MLRKVIFAVAIAVCVALPLHDLTASRSMVRLHVASPAVASLLEGADIWSEHGVHVGHSVDAVVSSPVLAALVRLNTTLEVMIPDVEGLISEQRVSFENRMNDADYNSNYHSLEEITDRLKYFANTYKDVDFIDTIGNSIEGRKVPALRFGRRATSKNDKVPTVWLEANIHAREWITGATTMYILQKLFEGQDGEYKDLFDNLQFYVAPVVNPDGFAYSISKDRLWRKNRRDNGDGTFGVDCNRNFGNHWGEGGASTDPSSDTYRGTGPFSEPETANIKAFLKKIESEGALIESAWDVHSYSQLILRPYGWATPKQATPPNDAAIKKLGQEIKDIIYKVHGTDFSNEHAAELYIASGGADDWLGADATYQQKAFTLELRDTGRYGFLLPAKQIIPSGEEILPAFVHFARDTFQTVQQRQK